MVEHCPQMRLYPQSQASFFPQPGALMESKIIGQLRQPLCAQLSGLARKRPDTGMAIEIPAQVFSLS
jgi:hypothetical protein